MACLRCGCPEMNSNNICTRCNYPQTTSDSPLQPNYNWEHDPNNDNKIFDNIRSNRVTD